MPGPSLGLSTDDCEPTRALSAPLNPLQCTLTRNAPASPSESTLTNSLDLKSFRFRSYKKHPGPPSFSSPTSFATSGSFISFTSFPFFASLPAGGRCELKTVHCQLKTSLFLPQRFDGVELRCLAGGIESEDDADSPAKYRRGHRAPSSFPHRNAVLDCACSPAAAGPPMRGTSGSVQRCPANPARPGREQR